MPVVFGFGVDDVIAGIKLIRQVVKALQDHRGSSVEYLEAIAELRALETCLVEVKALVPRLTYDQQKTLREWLHEYTDTLNHFLSALKKYHSHLSKVGTAQPWKDRLRRLQWTSMRRMRLRSSELRLQYS